jgi:hypothetical protein
MLGVYDDAVVEADEAPAPSKPANETDNTAATDTAIRRFTDTSPGQAFGPTPEHPVVRCR